MTAAATPIASETPRTESRSGTSRLIGPQRHEQPDRRHDDPRGERGDAHLDEALGLGDIPRGPEVAPGQPVEAEGLARTADQLGQLVRRFTLTA